MKKILSFTLLIITILTACAPSNTEPTTQAMLTEIVIIENAIATDESMIRTIEATQTQIAATKTAIATQTIQPIQTQISGLETEIAEIVIDTWSNVEATGNACTSEDFKEGYLQPGEYLWHPVDSSRPMEAFWYNDGIYNGDQFEAPSNFRAKTEGSYLIITAENAGWINGFPAHPIVLIEGIEFVLTNATCVPEVIQPIATQTSTLSVTFTPTFALTPGVIPTCTGVNDPGICTKATGTGPEVSIQVATTLTLTQP